MVPLLTMSDELSVLETGRGSLYQRRRSKGVLEAVRAERVCVGSTAAGPAPSGKATARDTRLDSHGRTTTLPTFAISAVQKHPKQKDYGLSKSRSNLELKGSRSW